MKFKRFALKFLYASIAAAAAIALSGCGNSGLGTETSGTVSIAEAVSAETEAFSRTAEAGSVETTALPNETNALPQTAETEPTKTTAQEAAQTSAAKTEPTETTVQEAAQTSSAETEPTGTTAQETTQTSAAAASESAPPQTTLKPEETALTEGEAEKLSVEKEGSYTTPEDVAEYIHTFGTLPKNFITKSEAKALGWDSSKGNLWDVAEGKSIGGDYFGNYEGLLPEAGGRKYTECDVNYSGGYRGSERIIFSNDGLIFYTGDHYKTFTQLY